MTAGKSAWRASLLVCAVPAVLLYAVVAVALWRTPNVFYGMYSSQDGTWAAWNADGILQWGRILDLSPFNPLSGMGSTFLPNLPWLNPGALALALPLPQDLNYLVSYTLYFAELFLSSVFLFRSLGLSPVRSSLAAQCYLILLFPPFPFVSDALIWYSLAPVNAHLAALANVCLALFLRLGRCATWKGDLWCALGVAAASIAGLFSAPITFLTYGPVYGLICAGFLVWQRDRRTLSWRLAMLAALAILLWGSGFIDYVRGSVGVSARTLGIPPAFAAGAKLLTLDYWRAASTHFDLCNAVQAGCMGNFIVKMYAAAFFGALLLAWRNPSPVRTLAVLFLAVIAAIQVSANVHNLSLFGMWHTLSPVYFMWSAHTFFVLFAVLLILAPLDFWPGKQGAVAPAGPVPLVFVALLVPALALYLWTAKIAPSQPPPPEYKRDFPLLGKSSIREPQTGPIVRYLMENASLALGDRFRGYVVTYLGDPRGHVRQGVGFKGSGMSSEIYIQANAYLDQLYGSHFQEMDLWRFNIPTLEEYGQWVGTMPYVFVNAFFSKVGDDLPTIPSFLRVYRIEPYGLAALGVRFIVSDASLDDPRMTLRVREVSSGKAMYLYELAEPNTASYSPARAIKVNTFKEALEAFKSNAKNLQEEATVFEELAGPFRKARKVEMRMQRDGFRLTAESDGVSLIVVPVQFSRCLRVFPNGSTPADDVTLLRANGIQTLLRFSNKLDVSVRLDFGLFGSSACRLEDRRDLMRLNVLAAAQVTSALSPRVAD